MCATSSFSDEHAERRAQGGDQHEQPAGVAPLPPARDGVALARQPAGAAVVGNPVEDGQRDDEDVGGETRTLDRRRERRQAGGGEH